MSTAITIVVGVAVAATIAALVRAGMGLGLGSDLLIRWRPGRGVVVRGRIPEAKAAQIRSFFAHDLRAPGSVTVRGSFGPGRSLRLRFSGGLSPGDRQRVRNFLVDLLARR
jgi:hypothetical protein